MFKIIEKLGGEEAFLDLVAKSATRQNYGRPSRHTVKKWKADRKLPDHVAMVAAQECLARGIIFDPADCNWEDRCASPVSSIETISEVAQ